MDNRNFYTRGVNVESSHWKTLLKAHSEHGQIHPPSGACGSWRRAITRHREKDIVWFNTESGTTIISIIEHATCHQA